MITLFSVLLLSGCGTGYYMPWGGFNTGIRSNNPAVMPNISWQTPGQRQALSEQSKAVEAQAPAAPAAPAVTAQPVPPVAVPHRKIIVSILLPLTGRASRLGQSMLDAAQMALFDIGSANFELVPRDTKGTPAGAVAAARAAIAAHSALILGPVFSGDLKAIKPVVGPTGTPVISFTTDWTLAGDNTYVMGFLPFTQVMRVAQYAAGRGYGKIAVFAPDTEYADIVISTLRKGNASLVRVYRYPANQIELTSYVQDFANESKSGDGLDFNALMLPIGSQGLRSLVTTLKDNGISQFMPLTNGAPGGLKFIGTGLWDDPALMNSPGLLGGWFAAPDPKLRASFDARYQQNFGVAPARLASLAYDATALAAVLARSAPDDADAYTAAAITNPRGFAGIDGIFRFLPDGLSERGLAVLEIRQSGPVVIDPAPTAFAPVTGS
ncbi:MAG: penicillin-binding protein activator [Alphaproteobacteria bacterium]|nr:penicillin-binding protein activator [Alphaproteobacteria bacterium]MDE2336940.1 penicillin-binding protein activator [Alphaproteobacteria bacterium]